ncbi:MAG TPA: endonuclease III [Phycisphaerae bacterium]|nr:endonuclease III [Phycisphaerae bacterium]
MKRTPSIPTILRRLERAYGHRPWRKHRSGIDGLIQTILSQNTTDRNSMAAFASLKARFPRWHALLDAPVSTIERAIRSAGLSRTKAPRIKNALREVHAPTGRLSLAFLTRMPLDDAKAWLQSIDGVGPKTAACVLMFCYNLPAFPVDTHVHRVARRLALIPDDCTADRAHDLLERMCPPALVYPFHLLLVHHGRTTCRPRNPRCPNCPLANLGPWPTTNQ